MNTILPSMPATPEASEVHLVATKKYATELWASAQGAARLRGNDQIQSRDIEIALAEMLVVRRAGAVSGPLGWAILGAAIGAPLGLLHDFERVHSWQIGLYTLLLLLGIVLIALSRRSE